MAKTINYEGKYLRYVTDEHWEYAERVVGHNVVVIVAITPDDEFLLVEQYRYPVQKNVIELTTGLVGDIDLEETIEEAAHKELVEEAGYKAARMEHFITGPICPGLGDEIGHFFFAHDLEYIHEGGGDETEDIIVHKIPMAALEDWLAEKQAGGHYIDPKVYTGLHFAKKFIAQKSS